MSKSVEQVNYEAAVQEMKDLAALWEQLGEKALKASAEETLAELLAEGSPA